jgi:hypothetical protein
LNYKLLLLCTILLTGCANQPLSNNGNHVDLFDVALSKRVQWSQGFSGYEANTATYHLTGDIGTITLKDRTAKLPKQLKFIITTSEGLQPMLEGVTVYINEIELKTSLSINYYQDEVINKLEGTHLYVTKGEFIKLDVINQSVRVTLMPKAMALIDDGLTLSWVDWYR